MMSEVKEVSHKADLKIKKEEQEILTEGNIELDILKKSKIYKEMTYEQCIPQCITQAVIKAAKAVVMVVREAEGPTNGRR